MKIDNRTFARIAAAVIIAVIAAVVFFAVGLDGISTSGEPGSFETPTVDSQTVSGSEEAPLSDVTAEPESSEPSSGVSVSEGSSTVESDVPDAAQLRFRNSRLLQQHYEKHGIDMGFASAEEYERAAAAVPFHPDVLHKKEAEDGDDVYYIESTNEFVIVSTDGYLRTYFNPDRGIDYYNKQ